MAALENTYYLDAGLDTKPMANMNNHFYKSEHEINYDCLAYNVSKFREINNL